MITVDAMDSPELSFDPAALDALTQTGTAGAALAYCEGFPDTAAARLCAAMLLEAEGDLAVAVAESARAFDLDPGDADICRHHGRLLLRSGDFSRAAEVLAACLDHAPHDFDALIGLSSLDYQRGAFGEARSLLERCITAHPLRPCAPEPGKPRLLRVLGYESAAFHVIQYPDGSYASAIHGGHFSPDHLLDFAGWNCDILNILGPNTRQLALPEGTDIVLNTISDPDRERAALLELALLLDRTPALPVINDPRQVLQTTREMNAARLGAIPDVTMARTERLAWRSGDPQEALREVAGFGFRLPVILRKTGSQTGDDTVLARSEQQVLEYFAAADGGAHYAIQFHDVSRPDGLYHKARVFFIDGHMYPVANLHHDGWSVHSGDRYSVMTAQEWTQKAEQAFIADPEAAIGARACRALERISELVRLDYFGIDFTLRPDGGIFVFEANASMRHNFDHAAAFPYTRPNLERISAAFDGMVRARIAAGQGTDPG